MPYKVDEIVQYGAEGVCRIREIVKKEFRGKLVDYYVLTPAFGIQTTIYIPMDNEELISKMRYTQNADELTGIIKSIPNDFCNWPENESENDRKARFKNILKSGNIYEIAKLFKTLYLRQNSQKAIGKKLHMIDEKFFKDAGKLLYDEMAIALGTTPEAVQPYMESIL